MSASPGSTPVISRITLALLEDSGCVDMARFLFGLCVSVVVSDVPIIVSIGGITSYSDRCCSIFLWWVGTVCGPSKCTAGP